MYRGQVCDTWLNVTMLEYRWTPRFIDNRFGLNGTERAIKEFMYSIHRIDGQERCKRILKALLCQYVLPPCNENNELYSYCREDCEAVFDECNSAMREMLGAAKVILEKGSEFAHVGVPDCTKLRYSADYKAENTTCVHFGLFSKCAFLHDVLMSSINTLLNNCRKIGRCKTGPNMCEREKRNTLFLQ